MGAQPGQSCDECLSSSGVQNFSLVIKKTPQSVNQGIHNVASDLIVLFKQDNLYPSLRSRECTGNTCHSRTENSDLGRVISHG